MSRHYRNHRTGGSEVARNLLAASLPVEGRSSAARRRAPPWKEQGCEIAVADMDDTSALAASLAGAEAVFILMPPKISTRLPGFPEGPQPRCPRCAPPSRRKATAEAVYLCAPSGRRPPHRKSSHPAHHRRKRVAGMFRSGHFFASGLGSWENFSWDISSAGNRKVIRSFLQPLDRQFPNGRHHRHRQERRPRFCGRNRGPHGGTSSNWEGPRRYFTKRRRGFAFPHFGKADPHRDRPASRMGKPCS